MTFRIDLHRDLDVPHERLFDVLADHEGYARLPGMDEAVLLEPGEARRNGVGALRRLRSGAMSFTERIVRHEPPHRLGYLVERSRPLPLDHELGLIELEDLGDGRTRARWQSVGRVALPIVGRLLDRVVERQGTRAFARILRELATRA